MATLKNYVQENCVCVFFVTQVGMFNESIKLTLRDCVNLFLKRQVCGEKGLVAYYREHPSNDVTAFSTIFSINIVEGFNFYIIYNYVFFTYKA